MADMTKAFASDLKTIREKKNLSLKSISQQTRLNISILENIERGDFTFQPKPYIRAFLKQYINSLDLDLEETLFDYDLARSGKYTQKYASREEIIPEEKEIEIQSKSSKNKLSDTLKGMVDPPKKIVEEKKPVSKSEEEETEEEEKELEEEKTLTSVSETIKEPQKIRTEIKPEIRHEPKQKIDKDYSGQTQEKKNFSDSLFSSPVVRYIFLFIFAALVLLGLYSLVNILFLEGSDDRPEVIRQNFDDVVKEQEQKILGMKTPEEIQDSIRKVAEELASANDSIILNITGVSEGILYLVIDSVNYYKPQRIQFEKNDVKTFKAHKNFFISADNTKTFKATVNDTPVKFKDTKVQKSKITGSGVSN